MTRPRAGVRHQRKGARYAWRERRFYTEGAPDGMCWSVREMESYGTNLDRFIPHLRAMARGLERASYETFDWVDDGYTGYEDEDNQGHFVIGLRPLTEGDKSTDQLRAEDQERRDREHLAELKARYPDG